MHWPDWLNTGIRQGGPARINLLFFSNQKLIAMRFKQNAFEAKAFQATCKRLFLVVLVAGCLPVTTHAFDLPHHINKTRFFQDTTVLRGKVSGIEEGSVLPQVSVQNLVSGRGSFTNSRGEFAIGARRGDSLRFSYAGKTPQSIIFRGEKYIEVHLSEGGKALSEVIVTGFQTIEKKKFAGSAATVKMDDAKLAGQTDISKMLEGRAAGVSVQNVSGTFGAAPKVRGRGDTSINGDTKP